MIKNELKILYEEMGMKAEDFKVLLDEVIPNNNININEINAAKIGWCLSVLRNIIEKMGE